MTKPPARLSNTASHLGELKPDPQNARKHNPRNLGQIERSMQANGFGRSILLANDGTIIAGNATAEAAGSIGLEDVIIVQSDGTKVIAIQRTDVAPGSKQALELGIADNRSAELAEWDIDVLATLGDEIDLGQYFFDNELTSLLNGFESATDTPAKYTNKIETPIYEPTGDEPPVAELTKTERHDALRQEIDAADIPEDVRTFLIAAATRHIVFDYRNIAEFYAHANETVQQLMEDSALVIIDVDRAIELGYAKMRSELLDMTAEAVEADEGDEDERDDG